MSLQDEQVLFEAEDETRFYRWQPGHIELDPATGVLTIHGHPRNKLVITIPVSEIASCTIVEREDISTLGRTLFFWVIYDETGAIGCPLALLLGPVAILDAMAAKRARFPVIRLVEATSDDLHRGWTIHLRSRRRRRRGRVATQEMAQRVAKFLGQSGYGALMPDLMNERSGETMDDGREHDDQESE